MENKYGLMDHHIKVNGLMTKRKAKEDMFIMMEMCTKDNSFLIRWMDMEFILIVQVFSLEDIGEMIKDKDRDKNMIMEYWFTKETIMMERNKVLDNTIGQMEIDIKGSGKMI